MENVYRYMYLIVRVMAHILIKIMKLSMAVLNAEKIII